MALPADYHMHTPLCLHAVGEPEEYARRAIELGLPEIGFSDHSPMRQDNFDEWRMNFDKLAIYVDKVRGIQKKFPHLQIRMAMEVDYFPTARIGCANWPRCIHGIISSARSIMFRTTGRLMIPRKFPNGKTAIRLKSGGFISTAWRWRRNRGCLKSSAMRTCRRNSAIDRRPNARPLYEKFLDAAKKAGCAIELNTAGLRKDCKEIYPSREILQLAFQKDVPITFGSDAHAPGEVGMNFAEAVELARSVGYTKTCRFEQRRRQIVPF